MAEYLISAIQREQGSGGVEDFQTQRKPPLFPVSGFDFSVLGPMRQSNPVSLPNVKLELKIQTLDLTVMNIQQMNPCTQIKS